MKKKLQLITPSVLSIVFLLASCTKDESELFIEDTDAKIVQQKAQATIACTNNINFGNLVVETSYDTNDTKDKDEYPACGMDDKDWSGKHSNGKIWLKSLKGDGHRTELKENSGKENNLKKYKKMEFKAQYYNIPEHGVTIGQVHNRHGDVKRPLARLYIDSDNKIKIKETLTTPNDGTSTYKIYTKSQMPAVESGKLVRVIIWTGLGNKRRATIRVIYEDVTWTQHIWADEDWNDYTDKYYLKAGVYTEGNDVQPKVTYSSFSISH